MPGFLLQVRILMVIYNSCGRMPGAAQGRSALLGLELPESCARLRSYQVIDGGGRHGPHY